MLPAICISMFAKNGARNATPFTGKVPAVEAGRALSNEIPPLVFTCIYEDLDIFKHDIVLCGKGRQSVAAFLYILDQWHAFIVE